MNRGIKHIVGETEEEKQEREGPAQKLLGRKVNVEVTEQEITSGKNTKKYKSYTLNDSQFEKEVDSITSNNRIFTPGTMGTMDYQITRLNVYINEEGVVDKVSYG